MPWLQVLDCDLGGEGLFVLVVAAVLLIVAFLLVMAFLGKIWWEGPPHSPGMILDPPSGWVRIVHIVFNRGRVAFLSCAHNPGENRRVFSGGHAVTNAVSVI